MNWKITILSHWKVALVIVQLVLLAMAIASVKPLGEAIDGPYGP